MDWESVWGWEWVWGWRKKESKCASERLHAYLWPVLISKLLYTPRCRSTLILFSPKWVFQPTAGIVVLYWCEVVLGEEMACLRALTWSEVLWNSTNTQCVSGCECGVSMFVSLCVYVCGTRLYEAGILWTNNLTTEHDVTELITPFHSEWNVLSDDINISHNEKVPKIGKIPLL